MKYERNDPRLPSTHLTDKDIIRLCLKLGDVFEISTERYCEVRPSYLEGWLNMKERPVVSPRGYIYGQVVYEVLLPDWNQGRRRLLLRLFEGSFAEPLETQDVLRLPTQFHAYITHFTPGNLRADDGLRVVGNVEPPERYREPPTTKRCEFYKPWKQKIWTVGTNVYAPEGPERRTVGPILPDEYKNCPDGETLMAGAGVAVLLSRWETGWTDSSDTEPTPPAEVVPHEEPNWADWDIISKQRDFEIWWENYHNENFPYSLVDPWKNIPKQQAQKRRNSIKKPLLQLLNEFDRIAQTYEEIGDTDVREQIRVALNDGYVTPKDGFELPETFGMFEAEGNAQVGAALRQFLAAANKIAAQRKNLQTAKGRLRSIQDENVTSDAGTLYDEYWGYVDEDEFDEE